MKSRSTLFASLLIVAMLLLAGCGAAAPVATEEPAATEAPAYYGESEAPRVSDQSSLDYADEPVAESVELPAAPMPTSAAFEISDPSGNLTVLERSNSMIIKNADVRLMVKDTDVAIDRATQIVGDSGGYIVSSRVWYQD